MKNYFLTISTLITIISCSNVDENIAGNNNNISNTKTTEKNVSNEGARVNNDELNVFKNDPDLVNIVNNISDYKDALASKNYENVKRSLDVIVGSAHNLSKNYGEEKIDEYFTELVNQEGRYAGTHDGNKCTRNLDGTTYWDQCSFWEEIWATFSAAMSCSQPPAFSPVSYYETYYNCVQAAICRNC